MGLCHSSIGTTNESLLNPNENLDFYTVLWLDNKIKRSRKYISLQQQVRKVINYMKIFEHETDCEEYIKHTSQDDRIILIINNQIGEKIISNIHHLQQIRSIYIYSPNQSLDSQSINQFSKVKSISNNYDEIIGKIETDHMNYKYIDDKILFDVFHINNSNDKFVYTQILIDILLQLNPTSNDMNDFLQLCRHHFKRNHFQLNIVREFQQSYKSNNAIWWLTRDTFVSHLLSKAFQTQNTNLIFLLRFFIRDIEQQLKQRHCLTSVPVYRYQLMSNNDLELLKNSIGQFISINNFLLTKLNRNLALSSLITSVNNDNYQSVLFEIMTECNLDRIKPYANIKAQSYSENNDDEVLFMLGSIFHINNIHQDENQLWIVQMELSNRTHEDLKSAFKHYNNLNDDIELLSFGYLLQKLNRLDEAKQYYSRLYKELPDEDLNVVQCLLNLGNIDFIKHDFESSLEWLTKAHDLSMRMLKSNDIFFAQIYYSMGHVYNEKHESKLAIGSYEKAVIIWRQSIDDYYLNIAQCMNNIAIICKQEKDYLLALECFKKIIIILEKYISHDEFDISKSHCNLGTAYKQLGQYELALKHYNLSLKILEKHYSLDHPNIAKALGNIGSVYALQGDNEKALSCYEKAADIYRRTLPPVYINNIKIEQLIQNLSLTCNKTIDETTIKSN